PRTRNGQRNHPSRASARAETRNASVLLAPWRALRSVTLPLRVERTGRVDGRVRTGRQVRAVERAGDLAAGREPDRDGALAGRGDERRDRALVLHGDREREARRGRLRAGEADPAEPDR